MATKQARSHAGKLSATRKPAKTQKVAAKKPTATSLHIGLNGVNPADYSGWSGPLAACEFDARDMAGVAKSRGMTPTTLLTRDATRAKTRAAIRAAARRLTSGDLFFLSYRGNYARFHAAIKARMPSTQTPNLFQPGPTAAFAREQPFSV